MTNPSHRKNFSSRAFFIAGVLFALGSFSAGLVHCAQAAAPEVPVWQQLAAPEMASEIAAHKARYAAQTAAADARCPVCGMYPARFPTWAAQLVLRDGSARHFDSVVEMLVFLSDLPRYGKGVTANDPVVGYVKDYAQGGWLNAVSAFYVHGSDAVGPMRGKSLPAFSTRTAATAFATAHGGDVLLFSQLTNDVLDAITGGGQHDHHRHQ